MTDIRTGRTLCLAVASLAAAVGFARDFDVRRFGAAGDGASDDTRAVQGAIDAAGAAGGGRVLLSNGVYRCGSLFLASGVDLHLAADARLLGSDDPADYVRRPPLRHADPAKMPRNDGAALLTADACRNVSITGTGVIDGNGLAFVEEKPDPSRGVWRHWLSRLGLGDRNPEWDWTGWRYRRRTDRVPPPRVVMLLGCSDVAVRDVTMTNQPAGWSYWVSDCDRVTFERAKILADVRYPNNDGIHINASRDVRVSDCEIETGDDSIVVRANCVTLKENRPCARVLVRNCRLRSFANGIRLGWVNDGTIRDVTFRDIEIHDSATGIGLVLPPPDWSPSDCGREATRIEDVVFENVTMDRVYAHPLLCYVHDGASVAAVRRLTFRNVRCRALELPFVLGRPDARFADFRFVGCRFEKVAPTAFPEARWDRQGAVAWDRHPEGSFAHADGFVFEDTRLSAFAGRADGGE